MLRREEKQHYGLADHGLALANTPFSLASLELWDQETAGTSIGRELLVNT